MMRDSLYKYLFMAGVNLLPVRAFMRAVYHLLSSSEALHWQPRVYTQDSYIYFVIKGYLNVGTSGKPSQVGLKLDIRLW